MKRVYFSEVMPKYPAHLYASDRLGLSACAVYATQECSSVREARAEARLLSSVVPALEGECGRVVRTFLRTDKRTMEMCWEVL